MAGFQDILNEYAGIAQAATQAVQAPAPAPIKVQELNRASVDRRTKLDQLTGNDAYRAVVANRRGASPSAPEIELDLATLTPTQLYGKYGDDAARLIAMRADAGRSVLLDSTEQRSDNETLGDAALSGLNGLFQLGAGIGGLTASIPGAIDNAIGRMGPTYLRETPEAIKATNEIAATIAEGAGVGGELLQGFQSDSLQGRRRVVDTGRQLDREDSRRSFEAERKTEGELVANLNRIGRDFLNSVRSAGEDSQVFGDEAISSGASLLAVGPLARGVGAATGISTARAVPGAVALMEGGTAFNDAANEVLGLSHEQLLAGSEDYRSLIEQGVSPDEAKVQLANEAGRIAASIQGPTAGLTTRAFNLGRFEANPLGSGAGSLVTNALKEAGEETIQGSTGALAQNVALAETADNDRSLSQGVGEAAAQGLIYGPTASAALQTPGAAVQTAVDGTKVVTSALAEGAVDLARTVAQPLIKRGERLINEARSRGSDILASALTPRETTVSEISNAPVEKSTSGVDPSSDDSVQIDPIVEAARSTIETAAATPEKVDPEAIKRTLFHAEQGELDLAPVDQATLKTAQTLVETQQAYREKTRATGMKTPDVVSQEIRLEGGERRGELSAAQHTKIVVEAVRRGDFETATEQLQDFMLFARLMQNKVNALNFNLANGDGSKAKATLYENLTRGRKWLTIQKDKGLWVNPLAAPTVRFAQQVAADMEAVVTLANSLAANFPELGIQPLETIELDARLQGTTQEVRERFIQSQRGADDGTAEAGQAATAENTGGQDRPGADGVQAGQEAAQEEEAGTQDTDGLAGGPVEAADVETTEAAATAQPEGGDQSTESQSDANEAIDRIADATLTPSQKAEVESETQLPIREAVARAIEQPDFLSRLKKRVRALLRRVIAAVVAAGIALRTPSSGRAPTPVEAVGKPVDQPTETATQIIEKATDETSTQAAVPSEESRPAEAPELQPAAEAGDSDQQPVDRASDADGRTSEQAGAEEAVSAPAGLSALFPDLLKSSLLGSAFRLPAQPRTRIIGSGAPIGTLRSILGSAEALARHLGYEPRHRLTEEIADDYQAVLGAAETLTGVLRQRLAKVLARDYDGKSIGQHLLDGTNPKSKKGETVELLRVRNFKALNLLDATDGKLDYNPELIESAVLGAIQWLLTAGRHTPRNDAESVAKAFDLPITAPRMTEIIDGLNSGVGSEQIKQQIVRQINRYWGLTPDSEADLALVDGIIESVAAEIIEALVEVGAVKLVTTVEITPDDGAPGFRSVDIYSTAEAIKPGSPVKAYPTAIEEAVLLDPEVSYVGEPPAKVARTQLNNPAVENSREQRAVIAREQKVPYRLDLTMVGFLEALDKEQVLALFGEGNLDERAKNLNVNHLKTLQGRNRTIESAYESLLDLLIEMRNVAEATGQALDELPVYFDHNFSSVSRLQMLGRNNPQASKLMREVLTPTEATLDLSEETGADYSRFLLAVAQALGVKVHNKPRAEAIAEVQAELNGKLAPAVELLRGWLRDGGKLGEAQLGELKAALGINADPMGFRAVLDYARLLNAKDRSAFRTRLYVEADGITNGPINAIMLATPGRFDVNWLANVAKGGVFLHEHGTPESPYAMNQHRPTDKDDLYEKTTKAQMKHLKALWSRFGDNRALKVQLDSLLKLMGMFISDVVVDEDGRFKGLKRGITKNPLTITLYGSGKRGIAGNFVYDLTNAIYERMSAALERLAEDGELSLAEAMFGSQATSEVSAEMLFGRFDELLSRLLDYRVIRDQGQLAVVSTGRPDRKVDFKSFRFSKAEMKTLEDNFLQLFVEPMYDAIEETVGKDLLDAMADLRTATQVQGILLEADHLARVEELRRTKGKGQFLSRQENDAIIASQAPLKPFIEAPGQTFYPAGSQKAAIPNVQFGSSFDDGFRSDGYVYGPGNPGVSGMPTMIIGMGDGRMIMNYSGYTDRPDSLLVFDGINLGLNDLESGSRLANRAAWEAMLGNPLQAVANSFVPFAKAINAETVETLDAKQRKTLIGALFGPKAAEAGVDTAEIMAEITRLAETLQGKALDVEAKHAVLKRTRVSVDQMAAVGSPYQTEGEIDLSGLSPAEIVERLNAELAPERAKLAAEETSEALPTEGELAVYELPELLRLVAKAPAEQKAVLRRTVQALRGSGYKVVQGSPAQLRSWAANRGRDELPALDGPVNGFIRFDEKTIYLVNPSSETLTHELIHAASFEAVVAHYNGRPNEAVTRLDGLMEQFLTLEDEAGALGSSTREAWRNAAFTIKGYLARGDRAAAVNEFMAWGLSNQRLIELGKQVQSNPLVRLAKAAAEAIRKLLGLTSKLDDSLYSQLRFNAEIVLASRPSVQEVVSNALLFHRDIGRNERLAAIEATFEKLIIQHLDADFPDVQALGKREQAYNEAQLIGTTVAETFRQNGLLNGVQESSAFQMIVAALSTQAEIDANALVEVQNLYKHVVDRLSPASFRRNREADDPADAYQAQQKYDTLVGRYTDDIRDKQHRKTFLSGFVALAMVNDEFRSVLAAIEAPTTSLNRWDSLDHILENLGTLLMEKLSSTMSGADPKAANAAAAITALTDRILTIANERQSFVDRLTTPVGNAFDRVNARLVAGIQKGSDKIVELADKLPANDRLSKAVAEAIKFSARLVTQQGSDQSSLFIISQLNRADPPKPLLNLANELIGRTSENAPIYDMIKKVRSWVQQTRQQFREHLPELMAERFSRPLSDDEWSVLYRGLAKIDLASLRSSLPMRRVLELLGDKAAIRSETAAAETQVEKLLGSARSADWPLVQQKAKELARFLNDGTKGKNLLRNAYAIARLLGERQQTKEIVDPSVELVEAIDQLVTLYAFDRLSQADKDVLRALARTEAAGLSFVLDNLAVQRADELVKVRQSTMAQVNHWKGYIPAESRDGGRMLVDAGDTKTEARLRLLGYEKLGAYAGSAAEGAQGLSYYYSPIGRAKYKQGILQNVRDTASGVDPVTGFSNSLLTGGQISDPVEVRRLRLRRSKNTSPTEALLPVYDGNGELVAYERGTDPAQELRLQKDTHLARAIGIWRGRQVEESMSLAMNSELVGKLKRLWDEQKTLRAKEFVNLLDPDLSDRVLRDGVSLINGNTLRLIEQSFGKGEFWVRRDMLEDVLGYREASIGDLFTGTSRWSPATQETFQKLAVGVFGLDAYRKLVKAETLLKNFVTDARVTIVVKSVIVPMANLMANVLQLMSRGVPIAHIVRGMPRKTAEIDAFVKNRLRRMRLEAELRAAGEDLIQRRRLQAEIDSIRDANRRLSIWPLIKAGEFASISDAGISNDEIDLVEGRLSAYIEKLTDRLPEGLRTAGRYGLVSKDTALFRGLQRAVEYGDFLGKALLFDELTKRQGLSQEEALARVTEEFVNYDRLPGRARGYLEDIGLLWFWNFKIRAAKIGLSIVRNNPLHALLALSIPGLFFGSEVPGSPVLDNGYMVMGDGRMGYTVGFDQALHAYQLNPWANALF